MNILAISDSHGRWKSWSKNYIEPEIELMIIAGDMFGKDNVQSQEKEFYDMMIKFKNHFPDTKDYIIVPGNHDFWFERNGIDKYYGREIKVLVNSGLEYITTTGQILNIWGDPYTDCGWSWAYQRRESGEKDLKLIPADLDILITHEAPRFYNLKRIKESIGDYGEEPGNLGLAKQVILKKPKIHIFGHIHKPCVLENDEGTNFYNVSGFYPTKIKIKEEYY